MTLLLLIGAGLIVQSLRSLKTLNPGFEVRNLLAFDVDPTMSRYDPRWSAHNATSCRAGGQPAPGMRERRRNKCGPRIGAAPSTRIAACRRVAHVKRQENEWQATAISQSAEL